MKSFNGISIVIFTLFCSLVYSEDNPIIFLIGFIANGVRTTRFNQFKISNDTNYMKDLGKLTNIGKHQLYLLGKQLSYNYSEKNFDVNELNPKQIIMESAGSKYSVESAQSFMTGFYSINSGPSIRLELEKDAIPGINVANLENIKNVLKDAALPSYMQAIPVHTMNEKNYIYNAFDECPSMNKTKDDDSAKNLINEINNNCKLKIGKFQELFELYDEISSAKGSGANLSECFNEALINKINKEMESIILNKFNAKNVKDLVSYATLSNIWKYLNYAKNHTNKHSIKVALFYVEQIHILSLMNYFSETTNNIASFANSFFIELHNNSTVKALCNNKEIDFKNKIWSNYSNFINHVKENKYINKSYSDFIKDRFKVEQSNTSKESLLGTIILSIIFIIFILGPLIIWVRFIIKKRAEIATESFSVNQDDPINESDVENRSSQTLSREQLKVDDEDDF